MYLPPALLTGYTLLVGRIRIESIGEHPFQTMGEPVPVEQEQEQAAAADPPASSTSLDTAADAAVPASLDGERIANATTSRDLAASQYATVDSPILSCNKVNFPDALLPLGDDNFKQVVHYSLTHQHIYVCYRLVHNNFVPCLLFC